MYRISMAPFEEIVKISSQNEERKELRDFANIETAYERGMEAILMEIAKRKLLENERIYVPSEVVKQASHEACDAFHSLHMIVTSEEQKRKLFDIDSAHNKVAALAADEFFIKGFVMGYRFLKELNNSYRSSV